MGNLQLYTQDLIDTMEELINALQLSGVVLQSERELIDRAEALMENVSSHLYKRTTNDDGSISDYGAQFYR